MLFAGSHDVRRGHWTWLVLRALPWAAGVIAVACGGFGLYGAWHQHRRITTYRPVDVVIISSHVKAQRHQYGLASYEPKVTFRYRVGTADHFGENCLPADDQGRRSWAQSIVDRYGVAQRHVGFYDPANPADAFLVKQYQFGPYLFVLFGALMAAGMVYLELELRAASGRAAEPVLRPDGWHELACRRPLASQARGWTLAAIVWAAIVAFACGHYFWHAATYEWFSYLVSIAAAGLWVPMAVAARRRVAASRGLETPRVFVRPPQAVAGEPIDVRVEQRASESVRVREWRVGLVCDVTDVSWTHQPDVNTRVLSERWHVERLERDVRPGESLKTQCTLRLVAPPTSLPTQRGFPRYRWRVAVTTRVVGAREYPHNFPLVVGAAIDEPRSRDAQRKTKPVAFADVPDV